jgi:S-adenosylmethionine:tRNA ribosyltransferase-isomerase
MLTKDFEYELDAKYIAQNPPEVRGSTNLLVLDKNDGDIEHKKYFDIPQYVKEGDVVVLNKTKVLKARIFPTVNRTGRQVEVLFLDKIKEKDYAKYLSESHSSGLVLWHCLVGRARHVKTGDKLKVGEYELDIVFRREGDPGFIIGAKTPLEIMKKHGHVPLPPYIKREDNSSDERRYNTIFSKEKESVAAPTASLNITDEILENIKKAGAEIAYVNLHVGWGTFAPVNTEKIEDFNIHSEYIEIPSKSVEVINNAEGRIWAFGTTVVRTLESVATADGTVEQFRGETDLYIYPPYDFKVADVLVTNFHAPRSSLVMLVSAFAGKENIFKAYEIAKQRGYKFLSYGDSMLII